jgi:hypothetical protein
VLRVAIHRTCRASADTGLGTGPRRPLAGKPGVRRRLTELQRNPGTAGVCDHARDFRQLVISDTAQARMAALFAQGLQTRGPLEIDLGDRLGTL